VCQSGAQEMFIHPRRARRSFKVNETALNARRGQAVVGDFRRSSKELNPAAAIGCCLFSQRKKQRRRRSCVSLFVLKTKGN
jgi:hypothetical protein